MTFLIKYRYSSSSTAVTLLSLLFGICIFFSACFPPIEENPNDISFKVDDPNIINIWEGKDKKWTETHTAYLSHAKAAYRYATAFALASVRDTATVSALIKNLKDPVEEVRQAAAFALGQIGHPSAENDLISAFINVDSVGPYMKTNAIILEALGKCGGDSTLAKICAIKSYEPKDSSLSYGQIMAIYRFGLRNKFCKSSVERILQILENPKYSEPTRMMAAHCIQRFKNLDFSPELARLSKLCIEEKNAEIRMALVAGFSRIGTPEVLQSLEELYSRGLENRVISNIFKNLDGFKAGQATTFALRATQNPSYQVSLPAFDYLIQYGSADKIEEYKQLADQNSFIPQLRAKAFELVLKKVPTYMSLTRQIYIDKLKNQIQSTSIPVAKASYIRALSTEVKELSYLFAISRNEQDPAVQTAIAETIGLLISRPDFPYVYKGNRNPIYIELALYFQRQMNHADPGVCAVLGDFFTKERGLISAYCQPDSLLPLAQAKLTLPRDIESYNEMESAISFLQKRKFVAKIPEYNHPVNWQNVAKLNDTLNCIIKTAKGEMRCQLFSKKAPATVLNFVELAKNGFYKEKYFHRVVPNFVIQGGCPRGDGYGGLNYTIRTEISDLNFQSSYILGMASAGANTECTQFFITHSPTPHLDGIYTAFGKLISGMDVLINITPNDQITEIIIE